jgi:hypothetical protein
MNSSAVRNADYTDYADYADGILIVAGVWPPISGWASRGAGVGLNATRVLSEPPGTSVGHIAGHDPIPLGVIGVIRAIGVKRGGYS